MCEKLLTLPHFTMENDSYEFLKKKGKKYLRHVHFARIEGRTFPKEFDEDARYPLFREALKVCKYNARISIEAFSPNIDTDGPKALEFLRKNFN